MNIGEYTRRRRLIDREIEFYKAAIANSEKSESDLKVILESGAPLNNPALDLVISNTIEQSALVIQLYRDRLTWAEDQREVWCDADMIRAALISDRGGSACPEDDFNIDLAGVDDHALIILGRMFEGRDAKGRVIKQ